MRADCGHEYDPPEGGTGPSGYARDAKGRTMCYACAEEMERAELETADRFLVYVASRGNAVTTWTGAPLGRILTRWNAGELNGYRMIHYRVRDIYGKDWHGKHGGYFSGAGCALQLRRSA